MSQPAIELKHLTFSYTDEPLFRDLSLSFPHGSFVSIIGPNGAGKTTLIRALIRTIDTKSGYLSYHGLDAAHMNRKEQARHISFVPQSNRIMWDLSVSECVAMGRYAYRSRFSQLTGEDLRQVEKAIDDLGLSHLAHRIASELSGGEYQRMLIARAIAQNASIIALDEPVSHLDIHHQVEILSLLKHLIETQEVTVITVLHDLNAAYTFSDQVVLLDSGAHVATGTPQEILTKERIEQVYKVHVDIIEREGDRGVERVIVPFWR